VEVAAFEEHFAEADGGVVRCWRERLFLMPMPPRPPARRILMKCWRKEEGGLAGADGEILLDFLALLAAEGWIG